MRPLGRILVVVFWWSGHLGVLAGALLWARSAGSLAPPFLPELPFMYWLFVAAVLLGVAGFVQLPPPAAGRAGRAGGGGGGEGQGGPLPGTRRREVLLRWLCGAVLFGSAGALAGAELGGRASAGGVARAWSAAAAALAISAFAARAGKRTAARAVTPAALASAVLLATWLVMANSSTAALENWWRALFLHTEETAEGAPAASPPSPLARINECDLMAVDPTGLFARARPAGGLDWYWVRAGLRWRRALLLAPPARLEAEVYPAGDSPATVVRVYAAFPEQILERGRQSVEVRVRLLAGSGALLAEQRRVLAVTEGDEGQPRGQWEEFALAVPDAPETSLRLVFEAGDAVPEVPPDDKPILAVAAPEPERAPRTVRTAPSGGDSAGRSGPNCLFILVDTLRADRLRCYGFPESTSPHLDRLAGGGVLFERVQSAAPWTVPSVASIFTGTYVATHRMLEFHIGENLRLPTLAEWFRAAGARTAGVSANPMMVPSSGLARGFEDFVGSPTFDAGSAPDARWVTDRALEELKRLAGSRFFLYLHYMDPHQEYAPPKQWARFGWTDEERYLGEILYCDSEIGRLLAGLEAMGLARNTLVVFTADHGEAFNEHGFRGHGSTLHREEVQVPLILRFPGRLPAGRRVKARVRSIDLTPTIAELVGLEAPRHLEGESLLPLVESAGPVPDRPAFSETGVRGQVRRQARFVSLSEGRYKLILDRRKGKALLYDVEADPFEREDIARNDPDRAAEMRRRIEDFLRRRLPPKTRPSSRPGPLERRILRNLGYLDPGEAVPGRAGEGDDD